MSCYRIKQKLGDWGSNFNIYNDRDEVVFYVNQNRLAGAFDSFFGAFLSIKSETIIRKTDGEVLCILVKRPGFFWKTFDIHYNNEIVATITDKRSWLKPEVSATSIYGSFSFLGDLFARSFDINKGMATCAKIRKKIFKLTDTYEITILDSDKDFLYISMVIAIDNFFFNN